MILKRYWTPGVHLPQSRDNIHVYYHSIQTPSPLKPFLFGNQSQILYYASAGRGNQCVYKNSGHMTKMAVMPIYVKNALQIFFTGTSGLTAKLLKQGYRYHKLRKTFFKFYRRHYELISKYNVGLKTLLS